MTNHADTSGLTIEKVLGVLSLHSPPIELSVHAVRDYAASGLIPQPSRKSGPGRGKKDIWPKQTPSEIFASFTMLRNGIRKNRLARVRQISLFIENAAYGSAEDVYADRKLLRMLKGNRTEALLAYRWLYLKRNASRAISFGRRGPRRRSRKDAPGGTRSPETRDVFFERRLLPALMRVSGYGSGSETCPSFIELYAIIERNGTGNACTEAALLLAEHDAWSEKVFELVNWHKEGHT